MENKDEIVEDVETKEGIEEKAKRPWSDDIVLVASVMLFNWILSPVCDLHVGGFVMRMIITILASVGVMAIYRRIKYGTKMRP